MVHGGKSELFGDKVTIYLKKNCLIEIPIEYQQSNLPIVHGTALV